MKIILLIVLIYFINYINSTFTLSQSFIVDPFLSQFKIISTEDTNLYNIKTFLQYNKINNITNQIENVKYQVLISGPITNTSITYSVQTFQPLSIANTNAIVNITYQSKASGVTSAVALPITIMSINPIYNLYPNLFEVAGRYFQSLNKTLFKIETETTPSLLIEYTDNYIIYSNPTNNPVSTMFISYGAGFAAGFPGVNSSNITPVYQNRTSFISNIEPSILNSRYSIITLKGQFFDIESSKLYFNQIIVDMNQVKYLNPNDTSTIIYQDKKSIMPSILYNVYYEHNIHGTGANYSSNVLSYNLVYSSPSIFSSTSLYFNEPGEVTISGSSFCLNPIVTIGPDGVNTNCVVRQVDIDSGKIYCNFQANISSQVVNGEQQPLQISVTCDGNLNGKADVFLYSIKNNQCPINNDRVCSNNGDCDKNSKSCICYNGYSGFDCSLKDTIKPNLPKLNSTNTIIETSGSRFDIGIIQIREININGNIIKAYNLTEQIWLLNQTIQNDSSLDLFSSSSSSSKKLNKIETYKYNTTLPNQSIINTLITVNNDQDNSIIIDFYGDSIDLLPNSVKYQIEIEKWNFENQLNYLELIFKSQASKQCDDENDSQSQDLLKIGDSIRTIQLTMVNGQTLVSTFSNRYKLDDKVVACNVKLLDQNETFGLPLSHLNVQQKNIITSFKISNFKDKAIIDPSFGALLSNDNKLNCKTPFRTWKIAVIVVCGAIGLSLFVILSVLIYKKTKNSNLVLNIKLKVLNK